MTTASDLLRLSVSVVEISERCNLRESRDRDAAVADLVWASTDPTFLRAMSELRRVSGGDRLALWEAGLGGSEDDSLEVAFFRKGEGPPAGDGLLIFLPSPQRGWSVIAEEDLKGLPWPYLFAILPAIESKLTAYIARAELTDKTGIDR
jgi:hypothetical protein